MVIDRNSLEQSEEFLVLTKRSIKVNLAKDYEYTDFDFQELLYKNGYYITYYELAYSAYDELTRILTNLIIDNSILDLEIIERHMKNAINYLLLFLKNVKILTFFKNDKFILTNKPLKENWNFNCNGIFNNYRNNYFSVSWIKNNLVKNDLLC